MTKNDYLLEFTVTFMTISATLAAITVTITIITISINSAGSITNSYEIYNYILTSIRIIRITNTNIITITTIITVTNHHHHYHLLQSLSFIFISTAISIALSNPTLPSAAEPSISILYFRIFFLTPFLTPIHFS